MLKYKEETLLDLIDRFTAGEEDCFRKIALLVHQDVLNIAYRYVGNAEDAKDILQEVLFKLYRKLRFFKRRSKASSWIYRVVINASIDFMRKRKRFFSLKERHKKNSRIEFRDAESIELEDRKVLMGKAMNSLSVRQKNVFILKHHQGLTIEDVSNILKCSQSTVKTHLARAVEALRKNIGGLL